MLALGLMLGCAPATEMPKDRGVLAEPPVDGAPAVEPAEEGAGTDATPEEDAKEEMKDEEKAAGPDPLDTTSKDPHVKTGEPEDPVNLK